MRDWLQFPPEVTPEIMKNWVRGHQHELDDDEVDRRLRLEATCSRAKSFRPRFSALFDAFLERGGGFGRSG